MTYPLLTIDQLHYTVARITTHQYNDNKGIDRRILKTATGFFYHNLQSDLLFLVTNRHVVRDRNYLPNVTTITLHSDENDMTQNKEYLIHLYDKITPIWRSPDHPEADVVAIPIDRKDFASLDIKYISFASNNLLPKDLQLDVGEDVFIMGYPLGLSTTKSTIYPL